MGTPQPKPHFFQPIKSDFINGVKIPPAFFKFLKAEKNIEKAVLRRGGKKWDVEITERIIEGKGWKKFAEDIGLYVGDSVMFRHEGNMEFEVLVFDSSRCEKECGLLEKPSTRKRTSHVSGETSSELSFPFFDLVLKPYSSSRSLMNIPMKFARVNGLRTKCEMVLIDPEYREWPVTLKHQSDHVYIGDGWRPCCIANEFKQGDYLRFELIVDGQTPVMKISVFYAGKKEKHSELRKLCSTLGGKSPRGGLGGKISDCPHADGSNAGVDELEGNIADSTRTDGSNAVDESVIDLGDDLGGKIAGSILGDGSNSGGHDLVEGNITDSTHAVRLNAGPESSVDVYHPYFGFNGNPGHVFI